MSTGAPKTVLPAFPAEERPRGLAEAVWRLRDRLVADRTFQKWAARLPIVRSVARRRASELFDLGAGFVYAQVLFACVRLRVFEILADGPLSAEALACRTGLRPEAAARLGDAAVALRLLQRRGRSASGAPLYGLGVLGASVLGNPGYAEMVRHHEMFYADLADPVALLKGEAGATRLSRYWPYAAGEAARRAVAAAEVSPYTDLMAVSQGFVAGDVLDAWDVRRHRALLDVGGGDGSFLRAAAARAPELQLMLFDLPPVAEIARTRFAEAGLAARARCFGGDFQRDPLPAGADAISLVRVAHDHDDPVVAALLDKAHAALKPGGTIVIAEPMSGLSGAESMADAYFGFYLLAMGTGRARSPEALIAMLRRAGFVDAHRAPTRRPLMAAMVMAKKAAA